MNLIHLFQRRRNIYYKKLTKYLKYVLNDHFVLALLLLGGALGFSYSEYVETLQPNAVLPRVVLLVILFGFFTMGKIRTLIEPADSLFLLPKEEEMDTVMTHNLSYTLVFYGFIAVILGFMSLPLLAVTGEVTKVSTVLWLLTLVFWKSNYVMYTYILLKRVDANKKTMLASVLAVSSLVGLLLSLFLSITAGLIVSLIVLLGSSWFVLTQLKDTRWDWENLIHTERKRVQGIYRLINLFVETPYFNNRVKRFRLLDPLFATTLTQDSAHLYYLSRVFVRNIAFSGLYMRLTAIGGVFIYFTDNTLLNVLISLVFLYLIGFQLLPLNQIIQQSANFKLYPGSDGLRVKSVQKLVLYLLILVGVLFTVLAFHGGWESVLTLLLANTVFIGIFIYIYLPKRLKRKQSGK